MKASSATAFVFWYEQRPLRERILLLVGFLVVVFFIWDSLVMNPIGLHKRATKGKISNLQAELAGLSARETAIEARKNFDPDRENRQRLTILKEQSEQVQQQLRENIFNLISPQEMPELLKSLLVRQNKLQLLSLENLPVETMNLTEEVSEEVIGSNLYLHRLRMEFAGDYLATMKYLQTLEELPRQMVWEELVIETDKYPRAKVRLQVYTLSLAKGWIGG